MGKKKGCCFSAPPQNLLWIIPGLLAQEKLAEYRDDQTGDGRGDDLQQEHRARSRPRLTPRPPAEFVA